MIKRKEVRYTVLLALVGSVGLATLFNGLAMSSIYRAPIHSAPVLAPLTDLVMIVSPFVYIWLFAVNIRNICAIKEEKLKITLLLILIHIVTFALFALFFGYLIFEFWAGYEGGYWR